MLARGDKNVGGDPNRLRRATGSPPSLRELGIEKTQSHRWQLEASVPDDVFEEYAATRKSAGHTSSRARELLHEAKELKAT